MLGLWLVLSFALSNILHLILFTMARANDINACLGSPKILSRTFSVLVDALSLWMIVHAGISRSHPNIFRPVDLPCCPILQNKTFLKKRHIFLSDLQCPPPFRATMTTLNKVAALPNLNLAIVLVRISRSETSTCPSCRSSVLSYTTKSKFSSKKTHFALRSTMSASISSDYNNVEQSCSASKP
jgi:hypothetical protein